MPMTADMTFLLPAAFSIRRSRLRFSLVLACGLMAGCSDPAPYQPPLSGVIHWSDDTEPRELEGSTVEFQSNGAVVAQAALTADGTFGLINSLPPGEYRLRLQPPANAAGKRLFPARYESFEDSGLTYTAPSGSEPQNVKFKLEKSGR
jgi:hypothetical protein